MGWPKTPEGRAARCAYQRAYHARRKAADPTYAVAKNKRGKAWVKSAEARSPSYRAANLLKKREAEFVRRYGITLAERATMFEQQEGLCAICSSQLCICGAKECEQAPHIDHDHTKTGRESVRGLLCTNCNVGIGYFRDRPDLLRNAAQYLEPGTALRLMKGGA